ncbi:MAG: hypothetical protein EAZ30_02775 [Betaproteobacteria bacterium]|nr:MAG: hypothetical protein EAZ30_02775 [Betaproteobacteria bacterium]
MNGVHNMERELSLEDVGEREKWIARVREIQRRYELRTDKETARFLGISQPSLTLFLRGETKLPSFETRFQILNLLGITGISNKAWELVQENKRTQFMQLHDELTKRFATNDHTTAVLGVEDEGAGLIAQLVESAGHELKFWSDRYGRGIWATLLPGINQGETVRELCEERGESGIVATDQMLGCAWLPITLGNTLQNAQEKLEKKLNAISLEQLQRGSTWSTAIHAAIDLMASGTFRALPDGYDVVAAAARTQAIVGGELVWHGT